jgi:integrase
VSVGDDGCHDQARQAEAPGLRWADVDLGKGALSVRRGQHRVGGQGLVHEEPKADRSRRTVALPPALVEALRAHRAAQLEERIAAGPLWQDHDLVFVQPNGRPIERTSDWRSWKALLRAADVREVRLHDGRHTAATLLLRRRAPQVVMEVLGHAQRRTTTDTYSHVMPALGRDTANRMGSAVGLTWHRIPRRWPPRWHQRRLRPLSYGRTPLSTEWS